MQKFRLEGKSAIVTGGSKGIGFGIATALAEAGAGIALVARNQGDLERAQSTLRDLSSETVEIYPFDMSIVEDIPALFTQISTEMNGIDILVNNAGAAAGGVLETLSDQAWETGLGLKFMGYVRITRAVIPHMRKEGVGRVINLIGNDGVKHSYWEIVPGAANAAGQNLTIALAGQYAKENITFCAVNPGPVRTERWVGLVEAMARDLDLTYEQADQLAPRSIPLGRIAEVDEVSDLVCYLASPKAHFVNGTMIEIDGGQMKPVMDSIRDQV